MKKPISFPLINPNEPEASLVSIQVSEGEIVQPGQVIAVLETTKATSDLVAEEPGRITGIQAQAGDLVRAGDIFCYLEDELAGTTGEPAQIEGGQAETVAPMPGEKSLAGGPPTKQPSIAANQKSQDISRLRISQPALKYAREHGISLEDLPEDVFITREYLEAITQKRLPEQPMEQLTTGQIGLNQSPKIIVYGGGGHGKSVIELIRLLHAYEIVGILDDGIPAGETILGIPVLGGREMLPVLRAQGITMAANAVGGIGNIQVRIRVFEQIAHHGFSFPTLVHPAAFVEASARLSAGVQVFPHGYVGSDSLVGFGAIINTGAIVSHDCVLGEYTNLSPGAILAGGVTIGARSLIGMGATINLGVKIGENCRVGNGATVKSDVPDHKIIRAGTIYPE